MSAAYKFSMLTETGFSSKMDGPVRSPSHAGVISAALSGYLCDDAELLKAAPALLVALKAVERARFTDKEADWLTATKLSDAALSRAQGTQS